MLFFQELILFAATQIIGIFTALKSRPLVLEQKFVVDLTPGELIFLLALIAIFAFLLNRLSRRLPVFFKLVLGLAIFAGSQTVFSLIFNETIFSTLAAILLAAAVLKIKKVFLHNIGIILALAGIGAVLGLSLAPISAVLLLLILSFYDIVAVYKTGHMVRLAENMIKSRAIFGLVIPQKFQNWAKSLDQVRPGGEFMILGSGDAVMPLILIASVIRSLGLAGGLIVFLFSLLGLFLTYYLFITQKTRRPMAALPPIAVASIVGYLVALIF